MIRPARWGLVAGYKTSASGGGFNRPQVAVSIGLEWRFASARSHQGRGMDGRTPLRAFLDGIPATREVTRQETDDIMAA